MKITRESHENYLLEFQQFLLDTKIKLNQIRDQKLPFGILDPYGDYYPCEYVETVDELYGLIKIYEPSVETYHTMQVSDLFVDTSKAS